MSMGIIERAARAIHEADAIIVCAGAGIGVDSGLPDFRGDQGFWKAYPMLGSRRVSFVDMANPRWFDSDPSLAWGFYGHRFNLYRDTVPHEGFQMLRRLETERGKAMFIFTSNVDSQFQKAGFKEEQILECHGSLRWFQCTRACREDIWEAGDVRFDVDPETLKLIGEPPYCKHCGRVARPALLMFGDMTWVEERASDQMVRFGEFLRAVAGKRLVIIETGAGYHVPTVRRQAERLAREPEATFIRINPRDLEGNYPALAMEAGAKEGLLAIEEVLGNL